MPDTPTELASLSAVELGDLARAAMTELAGRADQECFTQLLTMNAHAGASLAEAARVLATSGSWSQVADLSGTTKQAAWSRWSQQKR